MQNDNDSNAGAATPGTGDSTEPGSPQVTPGAPSGTPDNQNGTPTTQGDEEKTRMREEIRRLNAAVVEAKRGSRNNPQANPEDDPFGTPEGKYGMAIQVATSNLRNKLEDLIPLYPELPADQISRIRKNPWAYTKLETYQNGDWETAALEIETAMVEEAEKLAANKPPVTTPNPADISNIQHQILVMNQ